MAIEAHTAADAIERELRAAGDSERAAGEKRYLKSQCLVRDSHTWASSIPSRRTSWAYLSGAQRDALLAAHRKRRGRHAGRPRHAGKPIGR